MRIVPGATVGFMAVLLGIAAYAARPQDSDDQAAKSQPSRIIEFLPLGSVVDVSFSDSGSCRVVLLDDDQVRERVRHAEHLTAKLEALKEDSDVNPASQRREQTETERALQSISVPAKVVYFGEDFVRLEPVVHIPGQEKTSWFVLPESSISYIKGKN